MNTNPAGSQVAVIFSWLVEVNRASSTRLNRVVPPQLDVCSSLPQLPAPFQRDLMKSILRNLIRETLLLEKTSSLPEEYQCTNGRVVRFGSATCVRDLEKRLVDTTFRRDECAHRTADRSNYNGILASLRRNLKAARKIYESNNS